MVPGWRQLPAILFHLLVFAADRAGDLGSICPHDLRPAAFRQDFPGKFILKVNHGRHRSHCYRVTFHCNEILPEQSGRFIIKVSADTIQHGFSAATKSLQMNLGRTLSPWSQIILFAQSFLNSGQYGFSDKFSELGMLARAGKPRPIKLSGRHCNLVCTRAGCQSVRITGIDCQLLQGRGLGLGSGHDYPGHGTWCQRFVDKEHSVNGARSRLFNGRL